MEEKPESTRKIVAFHREKTVPMEFGTLFTNKPKGYVTLRGLGLPVVVLVPIWAILGEHSDFTGMELGVAGMPLFGVLTTFEALMFHGKHPKDKVR